MRAQLFQVSLRQGLPRFRHQLPLRRCHSNVASKGATPKPRASQVSETVPKAESGSEPMPSKAPVSIWRRLGPLTSAFDAFARSQKKRPYTTQIISAMIIFTCADVSAQNIADSEYDPVRTARAILIGGVAAIPQYRWFHVLARYFNYSSRVLSVGVKVLFNQFTFAVWFPLYFFGSQALLTGETLQGTVERLKQTLPVSWTNSWKVWPAAMAINLSFVPLEYRALFSGFVAVGWQTYLSWMNRQAEIKRAAELAIQEDPATTSSHVLAQSSNDALAT